MADLSPIQTYLDAIKTAMYGEDVRDAIHDSIARCYTDVDDSKTIAASAAEQANAAKTNADNAAQRCDDAEERARDAADAAESAASDATTEAGNARTAAANANTKADKATQAASNAKTQADRAEEAAESATKNAKTAKTQADRAEEAADNADDKADKAETAADKAEDAAAKATKAASDCEAARLDTITAIRGANTAREQATTAATMISGMTVSSENVTPDTSASVRISDVEGHKHLHFLLRQGATGAPFVIKGHAYATLSELESDITSPAVGDMYNVGTSEPYELYRWTGSEWETQGHIGISFETLTNTEIDSIWNGTAVSNSKPKYIDHTGLFHLIVDRIKEAFSTKVDKVEGKGLSTKDFTQKHIDTIEEHTNYIETLRDYKVDKVDGKGLSTNDFTTAYKDMVDRVNPLVGSDTLTTTAKTLTGAVNELQDSKLNLTYIPLRIQQAAFSSLPLTINNSLITEDMVVIRCEFGTPYAIISDIAWTTANGSITLQGTINGSTTADIILARV